MYDPVVPGKLTAVLLVGAFVTSAALPWSCAGPGETWDDGASEVTLSTFEFSNCHARVGWGSTPPYVKLISSTTVEMSFTRSAGTPPPWYGVNPIQTGVSSNYAAQPYDYYIGVNGTSVTVTLPVGTSVVQGKTYVIKDESGLITSNTAYRVTIATSGGNLIDGQTSITVTQSYTALTVFWTGLFWSII